ncbi:MAG: 4-hydroxythreonine-4-phosphate dehydrogenase PdxA [Pseudomonadota bacterium]
MTVPLAVTMGDPAGCGPIITAAAWRALKDGARHFYVVGAPELYDHQIPVKVISAPEGARACFSTALPVLPTHAECPAVTPGTPSLASAAAIVESIETATAQALSGEAGGVVTNPISKALLYETGFAHPGHTEFLAALCAEATGKRLRPVMMLVGGGLKVALATIHMPLMDVRAALTKDSLIEIAEIVHTAMRRDFALAAPRLAYTGLNPHAGEDGTIGREEVDIINPAAAALRANGVTISDARPADTVFHEARSGAFDAVIAMTHDQGLIPVKTLDIWGGVNTTLGLPIIRTSPDHGTAYEAAASGAARPDSLIAAIKLAGNMAAARVEAHA